MKPPHFDIRAVALGLAALSSAGCAFANCMLVSGFWSTAYGHEIFWFTVNAGVLLFSTGMGSLASSRWKTAGLSWIFVLALLSCLWTGISILAVKSSIQWWGEVRGVPILFVAVAGFLAGHVLPLALRWQSEGSASRFTVVFYFQSLAALAYTLVFLLAPIETKGYLQTALLVSSSSVILAAVAMALSRVSSLYPVLALLVAGVAPYWASRLVVPPSDAPKLRADATDSASIVFMGQSPFQKIVLTEERGENADFPGIPATRSLSQRNGPVQQS